MYPIYFFYDLGVPPAPPDTVRQLFLRSGGAGVGLCGALVRCAADRFAGVDCQSNPPTARAPTIPHPSWPGTASYLESQLVSLRAFA